MTNPVLVSRRLAKLRECIELLKRLRSEKKERFLSDPFVYGNAERYTQLSIQVVLDIGNHIIVHDYIEVDRERLYDMLHTGLGGLEEFAEQIRKKT